MITQLEKLLEMNYASFSLKFKGKLTKQYHPHPNEENYSIIYKDNEFIFIDEVLSAIEFNNLDYLKSEYSIPIKKDLEDNLNYLSKKENVNWSIYSKYSYNEYLVIQVNNYIYYEFEYKKKKFRLEKIRVSKNE